jgi:hypothetical protein
MNTGFAECHSADRRNLITREFSVIYTYSGIHHILQEPLRFCAVSVNERVGSVAAPSGCRENDCSKKGSIAAPNFLPQGPDVANRLSSR